MNNDFCKVFYSEKYGQILILNQDDADCKPEVRVFAKPDGLGVCSAAVGFDDSEDGWKKCDTYFESIDLDIAEKQASIIFSALEGCDD